MTPRATHLVLALALGTAALAQGCGGPPPKVPRVERAQPPRGDVGDDQFAGAVRDLLDSDPGTIDRSARLQGVVARQMTRAASRFAAGNPERGLASVQGALALIRPRDLSTLGPAGPSALAAAAKQYATRGDEGRARATYELLARVGAGPEQADAKEHLTAIGAWMQSAQPKKPMLAAAATSRAAIARCVLEPSDAALEEATQATLAWVRAALEIRTAFRTRVGGLTQEEAYEARRALEAGGLTIVALYLRNGDPQGALAALDKAQARPLVREETLKALEGVVDRPTAQRWSDLLRALAPGESGAEDEIPVDRDLLRTAAFTVAAEAYRLDPTAIEPAIVVADGLEAFGMAEVAPLVLLDVARAHPEPKIVSAALAVTMRAMASEAEAQEPDAARRAFKGAAPLLELADKVKGVQPSAPRLRATMGEIELREGRLPAARQLLAQAAQAESSGAVLLSLARIERHLGDAKACQAHLQQALSAPDTIKDPALRGEVLLMTSDVAREQGDANGARATLSDALTDLARARASVAADDRAHLERVLAQVLARFGADKNAQRALERALDATPHDKNQQSATLGLFIASAFVRGDLAGARDGLSRSMAAELESEDLVYHALWVRLLERQTRARTSGAADRVFASIPDDGRWTGKLAAFGAGKLKADDLVRAAKTDVQKAEALFYSAMDRRASGDAKGADDALRQVMSGAGVELMETSMARDMLAGSRALVGPPPSGVALP